MSLPLFIFLGTIVMLLAVIVDRLRGILKTLKNLNEKIPDKVVKVNTGIDY